MPEIVTDPLKVVTDELVLRILAEQGRDKDYVEFWHDYAPRSRGKEYSPYAKFYRDLKSKKRMMVVSGLPMVDAYGLKHDLKWREQNGVIENGNNIFHAAVDNGTIRLIVLSDQPYGIKKDTECSYHAQLFINGSEVLPNSMTPLILATDPVNPKYRDNVLLYRYDTVCRRRIRIIEGRYRERWLIDSHPMGRVEIRHNKTGALKLKLGVAMDARGRLLNVKVVGDSEIIEASEFDSAAFPVEIGASATYYPDPHDEVSSVDGYAAYLLNNQTWATIHGAAGNQSSDSDTSASVQIETGTTDAATWYNIYRSIFLFDTSALPDASVITAATMSLYGRVKGASGANVTQDTNIYESAPASNTALANGDYDSFQTTKLSDSSISYADFSVSAYNDWLLNASGRALISKVSVTKFGCRNDFEAANDPPVGFGLDEYRYTNSYTADYGSNKPKLVITYTVPESGDNTAHMAARMLDGGML